MPSRRSRSEMSVLRRDGLTFRIAWAAAKPPLSTTARKAWICFRSTFPRSAAIGDTFENPEAYFPYFDFIATGLSREDRGNSGGAPHHEQSHRESPSRAQQPATGRCRDCPAL